MLLVTSSLFRLVRNFTTSKEFLSIRGLVQDNTQTGGHIAEVSIWVVVDVLAGVLTSVTIDVLKRIGNVWLGRIDWWMIVRLSDLALPWLNRQKLFRHVTDIDSLLKFEEIRLGSTIALIVNIYELTSILVGPLPSTRLLGVVVVILSPGITNIPTLAGAHSCKFIFKI